MRRPRGWDRSLPEERKRNDWDLRKTKKEKGKTQASYHQYFIYLHYHVFKHLHSIYTEQTGTAFYAKEEGRQEKQRNKKLISAWKKHQNGKKPAWIYAEDGPNVSKWKKTFYVLCTYLLINWTRNEKPLHKLTVNRKSADSTSALNINSVCYKTHNAAWPEKKATEQKIKPTRDEI